MRFDSFFGLSHLRSWASNRSAPAAFNYTSSQITWHNVTDSAVQLLYDLNWTATNNDAIIDLEVTVPADETAGAKNSTLIVEVGTI